MTSGIHGLWVVDKPRGITSHDVVAQARRQLGTRAVGHAGTLDPMATGVLLVLVGEACKLSNYLSGQDKSYEASVTFGIGTDSLDADGAILEQQELPTDWPAPTEREQPLSGSCGVRIQQGLDAALAATTQLPPNVSAIHVRGERAYVRARRGEEMALSERPVRLLGVEVLGLRGPTLRLVVTVEKGYYVRSLARDLGQSVGVPAHLSTLRRVRSGAFTLDDAIAWPPTSPPPLLSVTLAAVRSLPTTRLLADAVLSARQGKRLAPEQAQADLAEAVSAWLSPTGELVALGTSGPDGHRVVRGFSDGCRDR